MRMELTREMLLRSQCWAVGSWLPLPTASPNPEHLPGFNSGQSEMRKCHFFCSSGLYFQEIKPLTLPKPWGYPCRVHLELFFAQLQLLRAQAVISPCLPLAHADSMNFPWALGARLSGKLQLLSYFYSLREWRAERAKCLPWYRRTLFKVIWAWSRQN